MASPEEFVKNAIEARDSKRIQRDKGSKAIQALRGVLRTRIDEMNVERKREIGRIDLENVKELRIIREHPNPVYDCVGQLEEEKAKAISVTFRKKNMELDQWVTVKERLWDLELDVNHIAGQMLQEFVLMLREG